MQHEELKEIFDLYTSGSKNWKESHIVILSNKTGKWYLDNQISMDADKIREAFAYFTGGAEMFCMSTVKGHRRIKVSTKGYYHYIGA